MNLRKNGRMLYISSVDPSLDNGPGINEREFIRVLSARYPERIHFLIPRPINNFKYSSDLFTFCHNFCDNRTHHNRAYRFIPHVFSQLRHALWLIRLHNFNFLIFRLGPLPIVQAIITRLYHIPYAIKTIGWGSLTVLSRKGGLIGKLLQPINRAITMDLVARATAVDVCTQKFVDFYTDAVGNRKMNIQHIDNATNVELFRPIPKIEAKQRVGLNQFNPIVGYFGGSPWEHGGQQMVEISPELIRRYPKCGIVIVGAGKGIPRLLRLARKLGTEDHCVFPGRVPYEKLPDYVNCFDVCISLGSLEELKKIGNSSQKLRQYLACGKPAISIANGNRFIRDFELGSLVNPDDFVQAQNAVFKWLQLTDEERKSFSKKARSYAVENLSIEKAVEERLDFWDRMLNLERR